MSLSDILPHITVRANAPGQSGTVTMVSSVRIQNPGENAVAGPFKFVGTLDEDGFWEFPVPATDASGWTPSGWTYRVKESFSGGVRVYDLVVPVASADGILNLSDVSPVDESPGNVSYVLLENVGVPGGLATLGEDGILSEDQRPEGSGSGGGAVDSVNGQTGVVVLNNTHVGAAATVHTHDDRYFTESEVTTSLAGKSNTGHGHAISDVASLQAGLDGKAASVHTHDDRYYTETEIDTQFIDLGEAIDTDLAGKANTVHSHAISDVTSLQAGLDGKAASVHTHDDRYYTESEIDTAIGSLGDEIDAKADDVHTHVIADTTGLQTSLDGKAASGHNHDASYSATGHNHSGVYSPTAHNHDASYSATAHNHDASYSAAAHTHDTRYYTETEADALLAAKSNTGHAHAISDVTGLQTALDGKADESTLTTKGDIYVATAAGALARLAVGANDTVLTADSAQAGGVKWAAAPGGGQLHSGCAKYGLAMLTVDIDAAADKWNLNAGLFAAVLAHLPVAQTISRVGIWQTQVGATPTGDNKLAIYTEAGVLIDSGNIDFTLNGWNEAVLGTPQALTAGNYYLCVLARMTSPPQVASSRDFGTSRIIINGHRPTIYTTGVTSLPASFTPSSYTVNSVEYLLGAR